MIDYIRAYQEEYQQLNYKQKCSGIHITIQGTSSDKPMDWLRIALPNHLFYCHLEPDRHALKPMLFVLMTFVVIQFCYWLIGFEFSFGTEVLVLIKFVVLMVLILVLKYREKAEL